MDKWNELRETIQELHDNNTQKPDVESTTRFLLNYMEVLDEQEAAGPCTNCQEFVCDGCVYANKKGESE